MTRPATFRAQDISRILKGAKAAGVSIATILVEPNGRIIARLGDATGVLEPVNDNEWDEVLELGKEKQSPAKRH